MTVPERVPGGRREASKRATRASLAAAAQQLFAERGYESTSVRDIASAANVTERTFYRYFDGKEALVAQEYAAWLADLKDAIVDRPADEPALTAVRRAMTALTGRARLAGNGLAAVWLFSKRPRPAGLRQSAPRPLLRFEDTVAEAIMTRMATVPGAASNKSDTDAGFQADVIARVAVAAFRSAMIRHLEVSAADDTARRSIGELIDHAFAIVIGEPPAGNK